MPEGLLLSLVALGCLCVGLGLLFLAQRKISWLKSVGASPDRERNPNVAKFVGGGICCIAMTLIVIVLNNPKYSA